MVDTNGDIYIVSKRLSSNKIYRATYPQSTTETITLELVGTLPEKPEFKWITAGDISPNGEWIILRNDRSDDYASIWHRTPGTDIKQTFGNKHIIIDINDEIQGEAICYDSDSLGFYTVSEHAGYESVPLWYYQSSHLQTTNQKNNSGFDWPFVIIIFIMIILVGIFIIAKNLKVHNVVFGIVIIIAVGVYASTNLFEKEAIKTGNIEIPNIDSQEKLLTVSYNSTDYNYSLDELISSFKSVSGLGTKINQIGAILGPNNYTGVPVSLLLQSIDDLPDNYYLLTSASDYEYTFSKENVSGKVELYNENGESCGLGNVTMILAYEINDELIDETSGGPLRIGFIDDKGSITHSSMWVSSVNKLIVIRSENDHPNNCNIPPIISINVSNVSGNAPLTVYFSGNASDPDGNITSYRWDFGDGIYDNKKDTYHTFKKAGSYVASFKVTDNDEDMSIETIQINVSHLVVDGCVSPTDFRDPSNDWENPEYAFDDNLYTLASCTKKGFWGWRWTGYLELIPPISLECNKIRFKAWYDSRWCNEIDIDLFFNNKWNDIYQGKYKNKEWEAKEFTINAVSKARVRFHLRQTFQGIDADLYEFDFYSETSNLPPVADFTFYPTNPNRNQNIYFTDESYDNDGTIVSWWWDFGDGNSSSEKNPNHQYTTTGTYKVKLTVKDNDNSVSEINKEILISPTPKDWNLTLSGISNMIVNRKQFETWATQYKTCWSDGNHTWCGLPLWKIIAMIDDPTPGNDIFNDSLAESGYTIRLTAGDSWITEIDSMDVAYNEGYLIVNTIDGDALPDYTPKGRPSWPLHLRGSDIHPPNNVGNIVSIEIILA
jgi:PKD repeat protein